MAEGFEKLFEPGRIANLYIKNRIVFGPSGYPITREGFASQRVQDYYEARAKGGAGLIVLGWSSVDSTYEHPGLPLAIDSDECIAGLAKVVNAIHRHGAKVFVNAAHIGRHWEPQPGDETRPVSASNIPTRSFMYGDKVEPHELTTQEVEEMVEKFASAALRAQMAGADGVQIHGAHGYLINQFFCPATNIREDKYGGSLERRIRIAIEIIERIKERCGSDYPVAIRINGDDYMDEGNTHEQYKVIAKILEKVGYCYLSVSGGMRGSTKRRLYGGATSTMGVAPGWLIHLAEGIKSVVDIPVMAVGGLGVDLELPERVLREGKADFVVIARGLTADPELPNKAMTGRVEEINWCIRCNECHPRDRNRILYPGHMCTVNAFSGKEGEWVINPAAKIKKILVVGGGPGGMEAARVARLRGHDVTLYEKSDELGGQILLAAKPPEKGEMAKTTIYLSHEIRRLGVKVETGVVVTPELVEKIKADAVILATGSIPSIPDIPGVDGEHVVTVWDVLSGKAKTGVTVVVLGGGVNGAETADYLAKEGKKVTIIELQPFEELQKDRGRGPITRMMKEYFPDLCGLARDVPVSYRTLLLQRLDKGGVKAIYGAETTRITDKSVIFRRADGQHEMEADTVVLAVGAKPNTELFENLTGKVPELYMVGDCVKPRREVEALNEGASVALKI